MRSCGFDCLQYLTACLGKFSFVCVSPRVGSVFSHAISIAAFPWPLLIKENSLRNLSVCVKFLRELVRAWVMWGFSIAPEKFGNVVTKEAWVILCNAHATSRFHFVLTFFSKGTLGYKNKLIFIDCQWLVKINGATFIFIGKLGNKSLPGQFWPCLSFASLLVPSSMAPSLDFWSCGQKFRPLYCCDMNLFGDGVGR